MKLTELEPFFEYKERQYRERRDRISRYCRQTEVEYPVPLENNLFKFCHNYHFRERVFDGSRYVKKEGRPPITYRIVLLLR